MSTSSALNNKILILGSGPAGLIAAKTLLDDGFTDVTIMTAATAPGGVWAPDSAGGQMYPGLKTLSPKGMLQFSQLEVVVDRPDLTTDYAGEVSAYMDQFFTKFLAGRAKVQWGPTWDRVVLCPGPFTVPYTPTSLLLAAPDYEGLLVHSSKVTGENVKRIEGMGPDAKVVIVGGGKAAADLAVWCAGLGQDVTMVTREPKLFQLNDEKKVGMRWNRKFLHGTWLGGWLVRKAMSAMFKKMGITESSPLYRKIPSFLWVGLGSLGGPSDPGPDGFIGMVQRGVIKIVKGVSAQSLKGSSLILSDGNALEADVTICATGYSDPFSFIPLDVRTQLGIEAISPSGPPPKDIFKGFTSLSQPPAPPSPTRAPHVYLGMLPCGRWEQKDLMVLGCTVAPKGTLITEIGSHWIASVFRGTPLRELPSNSAEAFEICEDHANWVRARYPGDDMLSKCGKWVPMTSSDQYIDTLLEQMGLSTKRQDNSPFGLGYYFVSACPARCVSSDDFSAEYSSGPVDFGRFLTAIFLVSGLALPLVLAHSGVIAELAGWMSAAGGVVGYGTIITYSHFFAIQIEGF
ncbi:FAD/NAD(P)-binding domain-containing protein [Pseudohyphozyma bogoriensis]|nr:FAD/NAD(P)-binding domain-containing protein [Pseudohyphozyma bogoriensis]